MSSFAVLGRGPRGPPGPPGADGEPGRDGNTSLVPVAHFLTHDVFIDAPEDIGRVWHWGDTGLPGAVAADDMYLVCFSISGSASGGSDVTDAYVTWSPELEGGGGICHYDGHYGDGLFSVAGCTVVGGSAANVAAITLVAKCPKSVRTEVWGNVFVWKIEFLTNGQVDEV